MSVCANNEYKYLLDAINESTDPINIFAIKLLSNSIRKSEFPTYSTPLF